MNEGVLYHPGAYNRVACIRLEDVARKFVHDDPDSVEMYSRDLIKCEDSTFLPGSLKPAFDEIRQHTLYDVLPDNIYTFVTYEANARTYGRHKDAESVLLIQAVGKMMYRFDDGSFIILNPGDALYIPSGVYHDPETVMGPRVTISCKVK